jgi:ion channel-forming bestrophin family protein
MHIGKGYSFKEAILWTRRDIVILLIIASIPTVLYQLFHWPWLTLPWLPVALLGTAVAFVIGFKNNASYDRLWEARRIWGSITNTSRSWAIMAKDYVTNQQAKTALSEEALKEVHWVLYKRHLAWLTALRYQLRETKNWEAINLPHNQEYRNKFFRVEEQEHVIADAIKPYLSDEEYTAVMTKSNKAAQILALQSSHLKNLLAQGLIDDFRHMELGKILVELYNQQGASERIKNFPYPRQYASLNLWFIKIFVALIPFGMIPEFAKMGENFVWMAIPFSVLSGWIFTTLERIGETSENPFEGSANDVPITTISRNIEIDMLEILDIPHQLKPVAVQNKILT